ncbi:unnamed protein product [Cylindrotheca closterium]|uniref:dCMP deaminase n=1 Tax=Cylindrotheca closterium TaxID=2856 RepID=A0AAD2FNR3_9STRA|nr:unnamed protein product [Cylindrotheca closterium]
MKEIGTFNDEKVPSHKRKLFNQKGCDEKEYPNVRDKTGDDEQTQGKRLKAESKPDDTVKTSKRQSYLSWDEYFLSIALLSSKRSKDPDSPSGACIVDKYNRVVAVGYNGFPKGCSDTIFPWQTGKSKTDLHSKEPYVCNSITNAICNKCSDDVAGCRLYVMSFPGSDDAKVIIQSRIKEVVILQTRETLDFESPSCDEQASRILLDMANVRVRYYKPSIPSITLNFLAESSSNLIDKPSQEPSHNDLLAISTSQKESRASQLLLEEAKYDVSNIPDNGRRKDYISWQDYFMAMAFLTAERSKDPNTQVGACIVDSEKRIIGLGYNGFPQGCSDLQLPWARGNKNPLDNKYLYVCHAEVNAIMNKGSANVKGSTIFVALFPCENCAKMIIQSGIKEVVYMSDCYHDTDGARASRIMFQCANVTLRQYVPTMQELILDLTMGNQYGAK